MNETFYEADVPVSDLPKMHVRYGPGDWLAGRQEWDTTKQNQRLDITGTFAHSYFLFGLHLKGNVKMKNKGDREDGYRWVGSFVCSIRPLLLPSCRRARPWRQPGPASGWAGGTIQLWFSCPCLT